MTYLYLITIVLVILLQNVSSLYNSIATWERRCFIEDVPDNTMIAYKWSLHLLNSETDEYEKEPSKNSKMWLFINKKKGSNPNPGPDQALRREQELKNGQGTVHFFAEDYGEYEICFEMQPNYDGGDWDMSNGRLYIEPTRQYQDEEKEQIEDTQDAIITSISRTLRKIRQIKMEQKYYKEREQQFRATSYLTSTRVVWYGAVTALTVISTGCFMMMNLKSFFIAKKLV